jgi:hypothetical protein
MIVHLKALLQFSMLHMIAKMFRYAVLFVTPTCFDRSYDHLQGVLEWRHKKHVSYYIKRMEKSSKILANLFQWAPYFKISQKPLKYFIKTRLFRDV